MSQAATLTALLSGPDQPGLVARVSGKIFELGGNILHADQHRDMKRVFSFNESNGSHVALTPMRKKVTRSKRLLIT